MTTQAKVSKLSIIVALVIVYLLKQTGPTLASTYALGNPVVAVILDTSSIDEPVTL